MKVCSSKYDANAITDSPDMALSKYLTSVEKGAHPFITVACWTPSQSFPRVGPKLIDQSLGRTETTSYIAHQELHPVPTCCYVKRLHTKRLAYFPHYTWVSNPGPLHCELSVLTITLQCVCVCMWKDALTLLCLSASSIAAFFSEMEFIRV